MPSNDNSHSEDTCVKLHLLQQRVQALEAALPRTDIGTLDVDGHREYHTEKKRGAEMMREYQEGVTKRLILGGVSLACTALGAGFADWAHVADFVKGVLVP
ncbi:MAG: hypothetical protein ACMV1D_10900 [Macromonas sp.]